MDSSRCLKIAVTPKELQNYRRYSYKISNESFHLCFFLFSYRAFRLGHLPHSRDGLYFITKMYTSTFQMMDNTEWELNMVFCDVLEHKFKYIT